MTNFFDILFLLNVFLILTSASNVCEFTDTKRFFALENPCIPIVNYRFLIPAAVVKNATALNVPNQYLLQLQAQKALNLGVLKLIATSCQKSYVSLVCANIYQKCFVDKNNNSANYNTFRAISKGTRATPVYQPCVSLCNDMVANCNGAFKAMVKGFPFPSCGARIPMQVPPASQPLVPYVFDQTNNKSTCFTPLKPSLANTAEPYIFNATGVCRGLTQTAFSPSGSLVNSSYAVLQAPFLMQRELENKLVTQAKNIPHWLTKKCQVALRKYMCSSAYLYPQVAPIPDLLKRSGIESSAISAIQKSSPAFYNDSLTVPSYPNSSICVEVQRQCAFVLAKSTADVEVNCSAMVSFASTTLHRYWPKAQILGKIPLSPGVVMSIFTDPNNMDDAVVSESDTAVICPGFFVVPNHPTNPHVEYLNNSDCAAPCVLFWNSDDWNYLGDSAQAICISGLILSLMMAVFLVYDTKNENQFLLIIYTTLSGVVSLWSIVVNARPLNARFCYDNAIAFTLDIGDSLCTAQAGIVQYTFIATASTFAMMYIDRVFEAFKLPLPKYVSAALILAPPIIPVASAVYHGFLGFGGTMPVCSVLSRRYIPVMTEFEQMDLPVLIIGCICGLFILLNTLTLDGYICPLMRHHYHFHCSGHKHSHTPDINPTKSGEKLVSGADDSGFWGGEGVELQPASPEGEDREEEEVTPEEKQKEDRYIDALLFVVPTVLIFGLFTAFRAEYYQNFSAIFDKTENWVECVFKNSNADYNSICGESPHPNKELTVGLTLIFTGNSIIVAPVYFVHMLLTKFFYSHDAIDGGAEDPQKQSQSDDAYKQVSAPEAVAESSQVDEVSVTVVEPAEVRA